LRELWPNGAPTSPCRAGRTSTAPSSTTAGCSSSRRGVCECTLVPWTSFSHAPTALHGPHDAILLHPSGHFGGTVAREALLATFSDRCYAPSRWVTIADSALSLKRASVSYVARTMKSSNLYIRKCWRSEAGPVLIVVCHSYTFKGNQVHPLRRQCGGCGLL
jgi:hypothetical protein